MDQKVIKKDNQLVYIDPDPENSEIKPVKPIVPEITNFSDKKSELQKENLSINSNQENNIFLIKFPASIGEIELPVFVNKDEQIEISIDNKYPDQRSFMNDRKINYKG